jgi:hypothetical protein
MKMAGHIIERRVAAFKTGEQSVLMKEAIVNYFLEEKSNDCTLEVNDF